MSLGFNFATLTNYNTGPDNGTPTKVDPASATNGFVGGTVIAPQHVNFLINLIADQLADAIDGAGGGTYGLASNLLFNGVGEVRFGNVARITSGGTFITEGSSIFNSGATFNLNAVFALEAHVSTGATFTVDAGGTLLVETSEELAIDDASNNFRLTLTPQSVQPDGGGAPSWTPRFTGSVHSGVTAGWQQDDVSAPFSIAFAINLPVGDDVVNVDVQVNGSSTSGTGGHPSLPAGSDLPSVALVRVDGTGNATVVARRADQSLSAAGYSTDHVITLASGALDAGTLPHTVLASDAYYIVVKGETGANAVTGEFCVLSISGDVVARSYRSATMVY